MRGRTNHFLATCLISGALGISGTASADLNDEMSGIFGDMVNTTDPQTYKTANRGGITGGSLSARNRIIDQNIVSFQPPGISAGCGGIDMQMGSFSAITGPQIVETLRTVASNAQGYAFQLALDNVFPEGAKWMKTFQKDMQALNEMMGNTCAIAKYGVDKASNWGWVQDMENSTQAAGSNAIAGNYDGFFAQESEEPERSVADKTTEIEPDQEENFYANLMWEGFQEANVKSQFTFGDDEILEVMMSMTGTIIRRENPADPDGRAELPVRKGNLITVTDLVEGTPAGSETDVYECDDSDRCMDPTIGSMEIESVEDRIIEAFNDPTSGAIQKWAFPNSGTMTNDQKDLISSVPLSGLVKEMAGSNPPVARDFVREIARPLSFTITEMLVQEGFRAANNAVETADEATEGKNTATVDRMRKELERAHRSYKDSLALYAESKDIKPISNHIRKGSELVKILRENARKDAMKLLNM